MSSLTDKKTKRCCRCKQVLDVSNFWKDRRRKDGLNSECKECYNSAARRLFARRKDGYLRKRDHLKYKARTRVHYLVKVGKLIREPCLLCGEPETNGHHLNYDFPEKVIWLCTQHHYEVHHEV